MLKKNSPYHAVVVGGSAGGVQALYQILPKISKNFPLSLIICLHLAERSPTSLPVILQYRSQLKVKEADEKEVIKRGYVYTAPAGYHLLVEKDYTFSLSIDEPVNFARPAIDVLFESAADAYKNKLIGILLSGANHDGAAGLAKIESLGGKIFIQLPSTAERREMPCAGIKATKNANVLPLASIAEEINNCIKIYRDVFENEL